MRITLFSLALTALIVLPGCWFWNQEVTVHGPENEKLKVTGPESVSIAQGQTATLEIGIERTGFTDPVEISVARLPEGVKIDDDSKSVQTNKATFILTAEVDAPIVSQPIRVSARGPHDMEAIMYIDLEVEQP